MNLFKNGQNYNTNVDPQNAEYFNCVQKYKISRANLLAVLGFTVLNILLAALNTGSYMLFSAQVPYVIAYLGRIAMEELGDSLYLYIYVGIALFLTLPYLFFWIFSKKHYGWMIAALVYFAIDCVFLIIFFDVGLILDIVFHIWVVYYLVIGVKYGKVLKEKYNFALNGEYTMQNDNQNIDDNNLMQ